jgi:hypothetical protein
VPAQLGTRTPRDEVLRVRWPILWVDDVSLVIDAVPSSLEGSADDDAVPAPDEHPGVLGTRDPARAGGAGHLLLLIVEVGIFPSRSWLAPRTENSAACCLRDRADLLRGRPEGVSASDSTAPPPQHECLRPK